jgi:DNA modification methylase
MNELSPLERDDLAQHEAVIDRGLHTFIEVGRALLRIRDGRLYREGYATFEAYCRDRWEMSRIHAHRMIGAAAVVANLSPTGNTPLNERQARPLVGLAPEEQRAAWTLAIETAPHGRPTGEHVRAVVAELFPEDGPLDAGSSPPAADCQVLQGDAREVLPTLKAGSAHCCLTSPPYFRHRDYGVDGQIGRERTPKEYVANLVEVFHGVARVLRPDGTLFVVLGDTYHKGSKLGIPDRVARALRRDGWRWRSSIIWAKAEMIGDELKGGCMPGSQRDRCTSAYETVLHLDRGKGSYFDGEGVRSESGAMMRDVWRINTESNPLGHFALMPRELAERCIRLGTSERGCCPACGAPWRRLVERERVPTRPGHNSKVYVDPVGSPYARHNGDVIGNRDPRRHTTVVRTIGWEPTCRCGIADPRPCRVLDPFGGLSTTAVVAAALGRVGITIELNPEYCERAIRRLAGS